MLPQSGTGHQYRQQSSLSGHQQFDATSQAALFNMDPTQVAKQMAALNAAGQARMASNSRGPSSSSGTTSGPYLNSATYSTGNHDLSLNNPANFQIPNNHTSNSVVNTSFLDPTMAQPNTAPNPAQAAMQLRQKQQAFLSGLAGVMAKRNTPLPPALTGVAVPNYDPTNSPWKAIEPSSEMGSFRLAGKDVNLFKLWGLVQHHGGGHAITNKNGWGLIAAQFDLPEEFPQPQATSSTSVANTLCQYYMAILYPFEGPYKRSMPEHQRRMQMAPRPSGASFQGQTTGNAAMQGRPIQGLHGMVQPGVPGQVQRPGGNPMAPMHVSAAPPAQTPHAPMAPTQRPSTAGFSTPSGPPIVNSVSLTDTVPPLSQQDATLELGENVLDQDVQGIKRKMEFEDGNNKRARQKTEPLENNSNSPAAAATSASSTEPSQKPASTSIVAHSGQPMRRKIEYIPLAREVDTYGGRDLKAVEAEYANAAVRPLRDVNDWGIVDIEALTMSLRSRLAPELSYALTTLTLLSTMRGQTQGTGFPIVQCLDLFEEILDVLEETAFRDAQDHPSPSSDDDRFLLTNRALVNMIIEDESGPFAIPREEQCCKEQTGPRQRRAALILVVSNLLRNFSLIFDNAKYMSQHHRVLSILFRLCLTTRNEHGFHSASPALSLSDLVSLRKDVLYTLVNVAPYIELAQNGRSSPVALIAARRAFDLLASYLVDPSEATSLYALVQLNGSAKPPSLADTALEVFTKISQTDSNRQVIAQAVSQASIRRLFESLVHRLPVVDADFQLVVREPWICYIEKTLMAIYSLAFLAPPSLKQLLKKDRKLGFKGVMLRMIRKFLWIPEHKALLVATRRAVEAMKMLDDEEDTFDTGQSTTPTLAFGMGYGEAGESGTERGTGLLGGQREMTWEMLMHREVLNDAMMFGELESLARVECP